MSLLGIIFFFVCLLIIGSHLGKKVCPQCKSEVPKDAKVCKHCRYEFKIKSPDRKKRGPEKIHCPECNAYIRADENICPKCGIKLTS